MAHDARYRVFVVRIDRTTVHTGRIQAVMTRRGDRLLHRLKDGSAKYSQNLTALSATFVIRLIGQMANEGYHSATSQSWEVSLQIFLLLPAKSNSRRNSFGAFLLAFNQTMLLKTGSMLDPGACQRAPSAAPSGFHQTETDDCNETERSENKKPGLVGTCDSF